MSGKLIQTLAEDSLLERDIGCMTGLLHMFEGQHLLAEKRCGYRTPTKSGVQSLPISSSQAHHANPHRIKRDHLDVLSHPKHHPSYSSGPSSIDDEDPMTSFPAVKGIMRSSSSKGQSARDSSLSAENSSSRSLSMYQLMQYERELRENFCNPICIDHPTKVRYREDALLFLEPIDHASWRSTEERKTTFADLLGRADLIKRAADQKPIKGLQLKRFDDDQIVDIASPAAQDQLRSYKICNQSLNELQKPWEAPSWNSSLGKVTKRSSLELRNGSLYPPRFSYDGDESFKSSSEGRDLSKFIEAPRYSFDGRESPATNAKTALRSSSSSCNDCPGKPPERHPTRLLLDTSKQLPMQIDSYEPAKDKSSECKRRSSNVVARLMGLEEIPEQMLHHQSKQCQKTKACTEEAKILQDVVGQSSSQARHHSHESYGSTFLQQTRENFWQKMKSDHPKTASTAAAAGLSLLSSDHKIDPDHLHGKIALRPAFPPGYLLDIMPHHLKQNNDLKHSSECKSSEIALGTKHKQCKQKKEFEGCIHRSQDVVVDSLWQSLPMKRQGGPRKRGKLMTEITARQSQLVKGFSVLKQVHDTGEESETSTQSESKVRKSAQKNVLSTSPIHSPKSRKAKMEDHVTGKMSERAPKNSTGPFMSNPAKIAGSSPSICHNKVSAKGVGKIESLSDSDASVTSRSSKRSPNNGQKVGLFSAVNLKTSHSKKLDQSKETQEDAQISHGTQQMHLKKKVMVRASAMMCSNSPGLKPTATKLASGHGSDLPSKNKDSAKSPSFGPKGRHSKQSSPEKEKKFSLSKPPQENEAKMVVDLKDKESEAETVAELEFYPQRRITADDREIAMHESSNESIRSREAKILKKPSDAQFGIRKDNGKVSSRFAGGNGLTEMAKELDQKKKVQGEEGWVLHFPVNHLQETEKDTSKTNISVNRADEEEEVDQGCVLHRHINGHVRAFEHTECFEMEAATPPDSPSSMNCEPDRHDFMENKFGEPPEHPSPLSVLDASLLLDACSPDLHNSTQHIKLSEFEMGDTFSEVTKLVQTQNQLVKCRKFRSLFAIDQSLPQESTNCSLNSKKNGASYEETDASILALYAKNVECNQSVLSKDEQFQYVHEILRTAEYVDKVDIFTPKFQSRDLPISKYIFDMIEKQTDYSINLRIRDGETLYEHTSETDPSTIQRSLLVDCVTDIVENKLLPNPDWTVLSKEQRGQILLRLVNREIQQLFSQPLQNPSSILPTMLEADLSLDWHCCGLKSEILDLVNCLESLIFKQLVDESLLELVILSRKMDYFHPTFSN